jgi:hypothetical protein
MMSIMIRRRRYFKIVLCVVKGIFVNMVNEFFAVELAAQFLFHNKSMLILPSPGLINLDHAINESMIVGPQIGTPERSSLRMIHAPCGVAHISDHLFSVSWLMKTLLALSRIIKSLAVVSPGALHWPAANPTRLAFKDSHAGNIYASGKDNTSAC